MPMTLREAAKANSGNVFRAGVIQTFAETSEILDAMSFLDVPGGAYVYNVEDTLPGIGFRGINEAWPESVGVINPATEILRIAGGDMDVDKALVRRNGAATRAAHVAMKIKAAALSVGARVIKGDSLANPREFDGLQARLVGSQRIEAGSTDGGDPLSMIKLDETIDAVDQPTHLIMSKGMRRRVTEASRKQDVGGHVSMDIDQLGRQVMRYNGLPMITPDHDELGARVLDFNEVGVGGSTATATSIYCVSFTTDHVPGLQNAALDAVDLGEIDAKPVVRARIDWDISFAVLHPRGAARLRGISNATPVA